MSGPEDERQPACQAEQPWFLYAASRRPCPPLGDTRSRPLRDTRNRPSDLAVADRDVDEGAGTCSCAGMSNVLSDEKRQQVLALGRLGWSLRRIGQETRIRRETASAYLRAAGIVIRAEAANRVCGRQRRPPPKGCPPRYSVTVSVQSCLTVSTCRRVQGLRFPPEPRPPKTKRKL